jgi:hypothetical protein
VLVVDRGGRCAVVRIGLVVVCMKAQAEKVDAEVNIMTSTDLLLEYFRVKCVL